MSLELSATRVSIGIAPLWSSSCTKPKEISIDCPYMGLHRLAPIGIYYLCPSEASIGSPLYGSPSDLSPRGSPSDYPYKVSIDSLILESPIILPHRGPPLTCLHSGLHWFWPPMGSLSTFLAGTSIGSPLQWLPTYHPFGNLNWLAPLGASIHLPLQRSLSVSLDDSPMAYIRVCLKENAQEAYPPVRFP